MPFSPCRTYRKVPRVPTSHSDMTCGLLSAVKCICQSRVYRSRRAGDFWHLEVLREKCIFQKLFCDWTCSPWPLAMLCSRLPLDSWA